MSRAHRSSILTPSLAAAALLAALCLPAAGAAGFSGSSRSVEKMDHSAEQVIHFAKQVEQTLADKGARVAVLGRMGRPASELPEGMHYTHIAFAVYSEIQTADGQKHLGYAIHNLYQLDGRPDVSGLVVDYPVDFFSGAVELEAGVLIPSPTLQQRLLDVITSPRYQTLHEPAYSVIANPYTLGRQNCTEFTLDVIQSAIYQTGDVQTIKTANRKYFTAQKVNVSPLKLTLGSLFSREVSLADQEGEPVTATFETIARYLGQYDQGSNSFTVRPTAAAELPSPSQALR